MSEQKLFFAPEESVTPQPFWPACVITSAGLSRIGMDDEGAAPRAQVRLNGNQPRDFTVNFLRRYRSRN
jgi:hypothetical protein